MSRSNLDKRRDPEREKPAFFLPGTTEKAAALLAALLLWGIAARFIHTEILIPSPLEVLKRFPTLIAEPDFLSAVVFSTGRIAVGFFFAFLMGILLAALASAFPVVRTLLWPYVSVIRAVPVASFIVIALIWMRSEDLSVFIAFLMVFPVIYQNTLSGFDSEDALLREMADQFRVPWSVRLRYIDLPRLRPWIRSACASGIGFAWKSGVAAEIIGLPKGSVGEMLYNAKIYFETPDLFCWTITIVLLTTLTGRIFLWVSDRIFLALSPEIRSGELQSATPQTTDSGKSCSVGVNLEHVSFEYPGSAAVLKDFSLNIARGERLVIMGPSGEGKTTLMRLIAGLIHPTAGRRTFFSADSETASDSVPVAFLFQEDRLLPDLSALANIRMIRRNADIGEMIRMLKALRLNEEDAYRPVRELSGGMQRRVAIARCLFYPSGLLLMDEPFKGLDEETRGTVIRFVREYTEGKTVILVTHDEKEADSFGGTVFRLI